MSNPTYWLCLFNPTTWQEFWDAGAEVMGFPETRSSTTKRMQPGDYLLGYMTGVSKWMARCWRWFQSRIARGQANLETLDFVFIYSFP